MPVLKRVAVVLQFIQEFSKRRTPNMAFVLVVQSAECQLQSMCPPFGFQLTSGLVLLLKTVVDDGQDQVHQEKETEQQIADKKQACDPVS